MLLARRPFLVGVVVELVDVVVQDGGPHLLPVYRVAARVVFRRRRLVGLILDHPREGLPQGEVLAVVLLVVGVFVPRVGAAVGEEPGRKRRTSARETSTKSESKTVKDKTGDRKQGYHKLRK